MVRTTLKRRDLKIEFEAEEDVIVYFDRRRLQQVLLNLLSNALKFQQIGLIQVDLKVRYDSWNEEDDVVIL